MTQDLLNEETIRSLTEMGIVIGNERYFQSIFETFQQSFRSDLDVIEGYIQSAEIDKVRIIAHRMKSSAKTIGAAALGGLFSEIEARIVQGNVDWKKMQNEMVDIRDLYNKTMKIFDDYLN